MFTTVAHSTGTSATTYLDDTVQPATRYAYRVKAINQAGLSRQSRYTNVTTPTAPPPAPPSQPTGLAASAVSFDSVTIEWDEPGDSSVTGYRVQRSEAGSEAFATIEDNTGTATAAYTDSTASADTDYAYRVIAVNSDGSSPPTDSLTVRTLPAPISEPDALAPTSEQDALTPTLEEVVHVPTPQVEEALIAMYQTDTRVTAYTATMTVRGGSRTVDEVFYTYRGFASGTPLTFGSMSSTTMTVTSSLFHGCPNEGCNNSTVTEIYYVRDPNFVTHLVFRAGRKIPDGFTLTIGDNSYDLADSGYWLSNKDTYEGFAMEADSYFWYDVADPGLSGGDTLTVTLDRPVYQAPAYDDVLNDVDWSGTMKPGTRTESVVSTTNTAITFDVVILGLRAQYQERVFRFRQRHDSGQFQAIQDSRLQHRSYKEWLSLGLPRRRRTARRRRHGGTSAAAPIP